MERSFGFDVLACPRCAGRMTLVALIRDATVVARILRHLRLPDAVPVMRPARALRAIHKEAGEASSVSMRRRPQDGYFGLVDRLSRSGWSL